MRHKDLGPQVSATGMGVGKRSSICHPEHSHSYSCAAVDGNP
jgi:hypothetical protein